MQMINSILNTIKHISLAKQFNCFWIRPYGECLIITKLSIKLLSYDNEKKKNEEFQDQNFNIKTIFGFKLP